MELIQRVIGNGYRVGISIFGLYIPSIARVCITCVVCGKGTKEATSGDALGNGASREMPCPSEIVVSKSHVFCTLEVGVPSRWVYKTFDPLNVGIKISNSQELYPKI